MYQEESILEFDKIKNLWAECALTEYEIGRAHV